MTFEVIISNYALINPFYP